MSQLFGALVLGAVLSLLLTWNKPVAAILHTPKPAPTPRVVVRYKQPTTAQILRACEQDDERVFDMIWNDRGVR